MNANIFDDRACQLGEGPLWHPLRKQLFWFDILGKQLLSRQGSQTFQWHFDEYVSAAGWVDKDNLLVASQTSLFKFNIDSSEQQHVCALESNNVVTRSNDGRADPYGGFWIGTMGISAELNAGAIYRYYKGELVKLYADITISNSICFSPDGKIVYFTDTPTQLIMQQGLDNEGWPVGEPKVFVDLSKGDLRPDGSVVDSDGSLWSAQFGAGRVSKYLPDGTFDLAINVGGKNATCPAFGGSELKDMYITTARKGLQNPSAGQGATYVAKVQVSGQTEHQVNL